MQINHQKDKQSLPIDERFEDVQIPVPCLKYLNMHEKQVQVEKSLGEACKKITSLGFGLLKSESIDDKKVKVFCSEKLLLWLIRLAKENALTEEEFSMINMCLKDKLMPYFASKYPLS